MPTVNEGNLEYLRLRVFLYKFTPPFTRLASTDRKTLSTIDRYSVDLNESFFSKYDITDFVVSYSVSQNLNEATYTWSVKLRNALISFKMLNSKYKIEGPDIKNKLEDLKNLSTYDAREKNIADVNTISLAKSERGKTTRDPEESRVNNERNFIRDARDQGLLLSDLVQPYDMISVFLYKHNTPIEEITGQLKINEVTGIKTFVPVKTKAFSLKSVSKALTEKDLRIDSVLTSRGFFKDESPLFANEVTGFIINKTINRQVEVVDTLDISGSGVTKLFGVTRKLLKSSLFEDELYSVLDELQDPKAISSFQNIYVGLTVEEIFADLFNLVYKIKSKKVSRTVTRVVGVEGPSLQNTARPTITITEDVTVPDINDTFFDISSLQVANRLNRNIFTIPPLLLAFVMKRRGFSYRQIPEDAIDIMVEQVKLAGNVSLPQFVEGPTLPVEKLDQDQIQKTLDINIGLQNIVTNEELPMVYYSAELNSLLPYFKLIQEVFRFFNPELRTPFEIIDEIKQKTFLEFFERPDGTVLIRPPQYNDRENVVFSSELDVISSSYMETVDNLVSRHSVGYGIDIIGQLKTLQQYASTDGKLLLQFGFMEAGADINPNVKNDKIEDKKLDEKVDSALFKYADFFLRLHNAGLKKGSIVANINPNIVVGTTYYDETNRKFGYITNVSKNVSIGGTGTMTLELSYVRDAVIAKDASGNDLKEKNGANLKFQELDRIIDISKKIEETIDVLDPQRVDPDVRLLTDEDLTEGLA